MTEHQNGNGESQATPGATTRLVVEVGTEYFPPGRTRVELRPDGQVVATTRLDGQEDRADGRIDPARAARLIDEAASERVLRLRTSNRQGVPDEPRYHIEVYRAGERLLAVDLWRSELEQQPELARVVNELENVVREVTKEQMVL